MIRTIYYDQDMLIADILKLHAPKGVIDLDPTYSKGNFYSSGVVKYPKYKCDIKPVCAGVTAVCATKIPFPANSINCIMFDPPFLATTGPSLRAMKKKKKKKSNLMVHRFGVFNSETALHTFYFKAMHKFYNILKPKGILIFKCQDKVSSGKNYFSHVIIMQQALSLGFYPKDMFILIAKNRMIASWQRNQQHARKYHTYFWVFKKQQNRVPYDQLITPERRRIHDK